MRRFVLVLLLIGVLLIAGYLLLKPTTNTHHRPTSPRAEINPTDALMDSVLFISDSLFDQWVMKPTDQGWERWTTEYLLPAMDSINRELSFAAKDPFPELESKLHPTSPGGASWGTDDPFYR